MAGVFAANYAHHNDRVRSVVWWYQEYREVGLLGLYLLLPELQGAGIASPGSRLSGG